MSQENVQFIRGLYDAFGQGDMEKVLKAMDERIEWREAENFIYSDGSPYFGAQAVFDSVVARVGSEWIAFTVTPQEWLDAGNHVVVLGTYTGSHKQTGKTIRAQFVHVWAVKGNRVLRFQHFTDTKQFAEVVG